jgi:polyferredoxin
MDTKLLKQGILSALGVAVYTTAIAWVLYNGEKIFGKADNFLMPLALLLLFVLSTAITGLLVLGKPIMLYLNNSKKEAIKLLIYTISSLLIITLIVFSVLLFM